MEELKSYKNWVVTYLHDKIPLNPYTMQRANVSDALTWSDYATANACKSFNQQLCLGFVLTDSPFGCVDLDTYKTQDQNIIANHKYIYDMFNTYSELSPQGGVHIWYQGAIAENKNLSQQFIEMYSKGHYMTVTGQSLNHSKIEQRQKEANELYFAIQDAQEKITPRTKDDGWQTQSDEEIINIAANAANGDLFKALWYGQWLERYPSQSEADQAFVNIVAFYTNSKIQVARIFHQCELGKRAKAHRRDYLYHSKYGIIARAWDQKLPPITFKSLQEQVKSHVYTEARKAVTVKPSVASSNGYHEKLEELPETFRRDAEDFTWDELPPGMVGEISRFIFHNAVRPVKEVAVSAAIAFMAGICGRGYNISSSGLNHYIVVIAPTAGGKEAAASGIERLANFIREKNPQIDEFMGPMDIASPQALLKHLAEHPCFLSHKGEMGFWLHKLTNKYAKTNEEMLKQALLDLYSKSGSGKLLRETIRADRSRNTPAIREPAFSLFGDATPSTFYRAIDEENVDEGLVSRFTIVETDGEENKFNEVHDKVAPDDFLINKLATLVRRSFNSNILISQGGTPITIQETSEAHDSHMRFEKECYEKIRTDPNAVESKLYSRAHLKVLKLAGLIAVGINPDVPIVSMQHISWARRFVIHSIARLVWRFERGEVGEMNLYLEQRKVLKEVIVKYWNNGWRAELIRHGITKEMWDAKLITNRYLQINTSGYIAFRKARNPSMDFNNGLRDLVSSGILEQIDMGRIRESGKKGIAYLIVDIDAAKAPEKPKRQSKSN